MPRAKTGSDTKEIIKKYQMVGWMDGQPVNIMRQGSFGYIVHVVF